MLAASPPVSRYEAGEHAQFGSDDTANERRADLRGET